jgi:hypothetical protein
LPKARVLFDFLGEGSGEVSISAGETVYVINSDHAEWWRVRTLAHATGFVPGSYLELSSEDTAPSPGEGAGSVAALAAAPQLAPVRAEDVAEPNVAPATAPTTLTADASNAGEATEPESYGRLLYLFTAVESNQLTVPAEARVRLLTCKAGAEWWFVEHEGAQGYVPQSYVQRLAGADAAAPAVAGGSRARPVSMMSEPSLMGTTTLRLTDEEAAALAGESSTDGPEEVGTAATVATPSGRHKYVILFDYTSAGVDELSVVSGQLVHSDQDLPLDGETCWVYCRHATGAGYVPSTYLRAQRSAVLQLTGPIPGE